MQIQPQAAPFSTLVAGLVPAMGAVLAKGVRVIVMLVVVIALNFGLIRLAPGDPAEVMAGQAGAGDPEFVAHLRAEYGLDRPLPEQFFIYLNGVAHLDLGFSYRQNAPVTTLIAARLPATLLLTISGFAIALVIGIPLGVLAALRAGRFVDRLVSTLALVFFAVPLFWLSLMSILLFSVWLGWLPASGMQTIGGGRGVGPVRDVAAHLVLPAFTIGLYYVAIYARLTRASVIEAKDLDFVRTAKAKGVRRRHIVTRHILRSAILPVITFAGMQAGQLVGGALLTETVFAWPGIGRLAFDALLQRDYPILLGVFLMSAVMVILLNILTDIVYRLVNPIMEVG